MFERIDQKSFPPFVGTLFNDDKSSNRNNNNDDDA